MIPLDQALAWLLDQTRRHAPETVPLAQALNRILAHPTPLTPSPADPTATIDGLALRAATTDGASDYAPLPVRGTPIRPGMPMPPGTDAVLPDTLHDTLHDDGTALAPIPPGHGVAQPGHDIPPGTVLPAGTRLTPLHLALLATDPIVLRRPSIHTEPPFLQALLHTHGAEPTSDQPDLILQTTPLTHTTIPGLAIRPGETTALGHHDLIPAIRLPSHPAEAAAVFFLLVAPLLRQLLLQPEPTPTPAALTRKITSILGQRDAIRVRLHGTQATPLGPAEGIPLLAATQADGWVIVPESSEGYPAGAMVPIYPA